MLTIAVLADRDQMPDPAFYRECLEASFAELQKAIVGDPKAKAKAKEKSKPRAAAKKKAASARPAPTGDQPAARKTTQPKDTTAAASASVAATDKPKKVAASLTKKI